LGPPLTGLPKSRPSSVGVSSRDCASTSPPGSFPFPNFIQGLFFLRLLRSFGCLSVEQFPRQSRSSCFGWVSGFGLVSPETNCALMSPPGCFPWRCCFRLSAFCRGGSSLIYFQVDVRAQFTTSLNPRSPLLSRSPAVSQESDFCLFQSFDFEADAPGPLGLRLRDPH